MKNFFRKAGILVIALNMSVFLSCSDESETLQNQSITLKSDRNDEAAKLAELQKGLSDMYEIAGEKIARAENKEKINLNNVLQEAYKEVYTDYSKPEVFDDWYTNYQVNSEKARKTEFASVEITRILKNAGSADEALRLFDMHIADNNLSFEDKADFIAIKESINFLAGNHTNLHEIVFSEPEVTARGWWDDWGKCASSIIGGAVTGATTLGLAGAAVGTVVLPVVGTVSAGVVGAVGGGIGGALTGAAAGC